MKKEILIFACLFLFTLGKAQDQLFRKDNTKLLVKVTEVTPDEIKYKLFSNMNGPVYVVSKSDVALILYENGQYEVINNPAPATGSAQNGAPPMRMYGGMNKNDSLKYYQYESSLAVNFFSFINNEVGLIYRRDFLKSNFNIIVPISIGFEKPVMTQSALYSSSARGITLDQKRFEIGLGINYYPSLRYPVNYYVGPSFRYMQFNCSQNFNIYTPYYSGYSSGTTVQTIVKSGVLSSYCYGITNGLIFRSRSRISLNMFGSLGFKSDVTDFSAPAGYTTTNGSSNTQSVSIYFWAGCAIGYSF